MRPRRRSPTPSKLPLDGTRPACLNRQSQPPTGPTKCPNTSVTSHAQGVGARRPPGRASVPASRAERERGKCGQTIPIAISIEHHSGRHAARVPCGEGARRVRKRPRSQTGSPCYVILSSRSVRTFPKRLKAPSMVPGSVKSTPAVRISVSGSSEPPALSRSRYCSRPSCDSSTRSAKICEAQKLVAYL